MGMIVGSQPDKGRATPQVNITPLVDVALVVLIIFMIVTPMLTKTMWLNIPKPPDANEADSGDEPIVITIDERGATAINRKATPRDELVTSVRGMLATRSQKTVHVDAADSVSYGDLVSIVDACRSSGAKSIAVATKRIE